MKLFTVGPVEMFPNTLKVAGKQLPYFRTPEFSNIMLENEILIKQSVNAPEMSKTVFLTASGTAAMEAAVINCFTELDKLLIINGGSFGQRFSDICRIHKVPYSEICLEFGENLTSEKLACYEGSGYTGLLVNLHETSNGKLYDISILSEFCKKNNMYFVVDAISAFGADEVDFKKYCIDVLIVSSQKALALSPGIAISVISEKIYNERIRLIDSGNLYLDFKQHIDNQKRGQTPFTPAVGILLELNERLKWINKQGIENVRLQTQKLAVKFRREMKNNGFDVPQYPLSNALTPVIVKPYAKEMYRCLKEQFGFVVTPNGGQDADTIIRVGHLGNLQWQDYEKLVEAMKRVRKNYEKGNTEG